MIVEAKKIVRAREAELLKWLRAQYREAMAHKRQAVRNKLYGEAHHAEGIASAYAYMILHVERHKHP